MSVVSRENAETKKAPQIEIERKFLITALPEALDLTALGGEPIIQGYLANGSGKNTVRIRKKGDVYQWTVKQKYGLNPAERLELECKISEEQFDTMWPATEDRRLEKTRYKIPHGEHIIELDIFEGANQGMMLAEVEFESTYDAEMFEPPDWFGLDVTADGRFGNANIAKYGFPDFDIG